MPDRVSRPLLLRLGAIFLIVLMGVQSLAPAVHEILTAAPPGQSAALLSGDGSLAGHTGRGHDAATCILCQAIAQGKIGYVAPPLATAVGPALPAGLVSGFDSHFVTPVIRGGVWTRGPPGKA